MLLGRHWRERERTDADWLLLDAIDRKALERSGLCAWEVGRGGRNSPQKPASDWCAVRSFLLLRPEVPEKQISRKGRKEKTG